MLPAVLLGSWVVGWVGGWVDGWVEWVGGWVGGWVGFYLPVVEVLVCFFGQAAVHLNRGKVGVVEGEGGAGDGALPFLFGGVGGCVGGWMCGWMGFLVEWVGGLGERTRACQGAGKAV